MSTAQCNSYTGVLILNLWVERQWGFAAGCGRRRGVILFSSLNSHCLARCLSVFVLQQTTLWGCTECSLFPFSSPLGSSVCVLRGLWLHLGSHWTLCCRNKRRPAPTRPFSRSAAYRSRWCTGLSLDCCLLPKLRARAVCWVRQNSAETGCHHPRMVAWLWGERLGSQQVAPGTGNCLDVMLNVSGLEFGSRGNTGCNCRKGKGRGRVWWQVKKR